jgi:hypothetical protein
MRYLTTTEAHLMLLAGQQNAALLEETLVRGVKVDTYDENRTSPLHIACRSGNLAIVVTLLDWGASVNITDCAGWAPLHVASYCRRADIVSTLLQRGADPTIANARGETPWDIASDETTQTVFTEFYKEFDDSRRKAKPTEADTYIPGPLNLSALENSQMQENFFNPSRQPQESRGDLVYIPEP